MDMDILKEKYAKDIKADAATQSLQKQIRQLKQQLAQQRSQREKAERKHASTREKEQKQLEQYRLKLRLALEQTISKHRREYSKALLRAGNRKLKRSISGGAGNPSMPVNAASALLSKLSSAATIMTEKPSSWGPAEQEALSLETSILRSLHRTLALQNQCDVAQKYASQLTSCLKRTRAGLDHERAELSRYQMVLDGTERAWSVLYPELVAQQEGLIAKITACTTGKGEETSCKTGRALLWLDHQQQQQQQNISISTLGGGDSSMNSSIPRVIVPSIPTPRRRQQQQQQQQQQQCSIPSSNGNSRNPTSTNNHTRMSFVSTRSDGISDLGESLADVAAAAGYSVVGDTASVGESSTRSSGASTHRHNYLFVPPGGPVFTSVEALQQQTLQHLATGVC